ncbi:Oxidoreductase [Stygiomarasmius scandens]|uniref:Mitochondrial intermembrane space import and assembly protein 40 n=1 Tax=Marasmiellus scandens TaxID=2682957 RepID=A0ABR1K5T5_9AGAR
MFSQSWKRFPLQRCLHTRVVHKTPLFNSRLALALGASAATASYLTWRLTFDQRIALDSVSTASHSSSETFRATTEPEPFHATTESEPFHATTESEPSHATTEPESSHATTGSEPSHATTSESSPKPENENENDASSENEGSSGGAYNPVTGEINWDCPCLGGMAYGPCGQEFRDAFSCFIYSEEEPKGINCVEKFQAMQTCFRAHPEVYKDEIMDDEDEEQVPADASSTSPAEEPTQKTAA